MLQLQMWRGELPASGVALFAELIADLPQSYRPVIRPAIAKQSSTLGIESPELLATHRPGISLRSVASDLVAGEVIRKGDAVFVIDVRSPRQSSLFALESDAADSEPEMSDNLIVRVSAIGRRIPESAITTMIALVKETMKVDLEPFRFRSSEFERLQTEFGEPLQELDEVDIEAASHLTDPDLRTLAIAVASSGGLLVGDLDRQLRKEAKHRTEALREELERTGLASTEIVVVCRKTSSQVARVPTLEDLQQMADGGLRCACGRSVVEERIEEALGLTGVGKSLLDGSRWLSLLLVRELLAVGIPLDSILIEQEMGGDEVDCIANMNGELVLFELKDKEFSLGNAYSFGAKMGIIRPKHPVVATTQRVAEDAKEHFQRAASAGRPRQRLYYDDEGQPNPVRYIEGIDQLRPGIERLMSEINQKDAADILERVLSSAVIDTSAVVSHLS